ncbi:MAG: hypothetical protein GY719_05165 [bacterium]|nr:hypothetical protein [bacterium]
MTERLDMTMRRWLAAEQAGREADAERALARMFAALPMSAASAGFADRVLASAGLRSTALAWWGRAAVAALLLITGLALAYTLPLVVGLAALVAPGEVFAAVVQGFVGLANRVDEVVAIWHILARVMETLTAIATAPPVAITLLTLTILSAATFRGLSGLLSPERSPGYVQAH